jgi:hypothetical protein
MQIKNTALLYALLAMTAPAMAQNKPVSPSVETRGKTWDRTQDTATLAPQKVEVLRRPPIPHQPFEMLDYSTRQPRPMRANEMMKPFPDGRRSMTAGEYYKELNRIEKDLNAIGHTLRDKDKKSILIGRTLPDQSAIERQRQDVRRQLKPSRPINVKTEPLEKPRRVKVQVAAAPAVPGPRRLAVLESTSPFPPGTPAKTGSPLTSNPAGAARNGAFQTYTGTKNSGEVPGTPEYQEKLLRGDILLSVDVPADKSLLKNPEHFNVGFGDPSIVAAGFSAWVEHSLTGDDVTMGVFANGGMTLIGKNVKLVDAAAWATSGPTRNAAHTHVTVVGENLFAPFNIDQAGPIDKILDHQSKAVDQSVRFHIVIGIIPVAVAIGGKGEVGYDARLIVKNRRVNVEFVPYAQVDGFVEAGVDIGIAGAGIYGNFVIVKDTVSAWGQMGFKGKFPPPLAEPDFPTTFNGSTLRLYEEATRPQFFVALGVDNTIEMFSGSVGVYAYIYVPDCCVPPWTKLEYRHDLVSWTGIRSGPDQIFGTGEIPIYLTRPLTQAELVELRKQVVLARGFGRGVKDKLPVANTPRAFEPSREFASKKNTNGAAEAAALLNKPAAPFNAPASSNAGIAAAPFATAKAEGALTKGPSLLSKSATSLAPNAALMSKPAAPNNGASLFATATPDVMARAPAQSSTPFNNLPTAPPKNSFTEQRLAGKQEPHSYRMGGDYATGSVTNVQVCQLVCEREAQCKAWTYVTASAQCQLKSVVPAKTEGSCCIAGVK